MGLETDNFRTILPLLSNDQMFSLKKEGTGLRFKSLVRLQFALLHQTLLKVPLCFTKQIDKHPQV